MTLVEIKPDVVNEEHDTLALSRLNLADRIELEWYGHRGPGVAPRPISGASHESPSTESTTDTEKKESEK